MNELLLKMAELSLESEIRCPRKLSTQTMMTEEPQTGSGMNLLDRFESLPLELRQQICEYTITPFKTLSAPLEYIGLSFCKQRIAFKAEMRCLRRLGEHVLGCREFGSIEKNGERLGR